MEEYTEDNISLKRKFPQGCRIINIHRGKGYRSIWVYGELRDKDNNLLISATLDYIIQELDEGEIC